MMSRRIHLKSELNGAIGKNSYAKNQLSVPGSFFTQFVTDILIEPRFACLCCASGRHLVSAGGTHHGIMESLSPFCN